MARRISVSVSKNDCIVPGYSSFDVMQLCRLADQRATLKNVPVAPLDDIYLHVMAELQTHDFSCSCCRKSFQKKIGQGRGGSKDSLSLHRVIAGLGYVPSNIKVICQGCNNSIGEINNYDDVIARVRAMRWQAKLMLRLAKKTFKTVDSLD